ncbi:hypothetical protein KGF57_003446 [Candida theae]|uniref:A to I editase domain-containing protein n=1 Tax=Candida theae TaxID=1198502 RepID=A0AAD5BCT3_9ASCO|nr:uncharacterized protein KGF57_003446 [Candida theae]KAI5955961.1 hypothetical protein KGF57_003446 [Candida theae]
MVNELGSDIATAVITEFNKLNAKSGKPTTRSNGVKEWTVLAGVVAITSDSKITPITLATGVKVLPDKVRSYSNGKVVHDMHAEILALRLFNYFLLEEASNLPSAWVERYHNQVRFRKDAKLALFVSEPPCGDVSMNYLSSLLESNDSWTSSSTEGFYRGRNHFDQLGVVRTKPGRTDSLISYSKSCSDKLCLKQLTGICNAATSHIFEPIYLEYLVVNNVDTADFDRCFKNRFQTENGHYLKLLKYKTKAYEFHKSDEKEPSPLSLLYIVPHNLLQVLNNGVKNGAFIKNKAPKPGGESIISNKSFLQKLTRICKVNESRYSQFKAFHNTRQAIKQEGRDLLQNWRPTSIDDFDL